MKVLKSIFFSTTFSLLSLYVAAQESQVLLNKQQLSKPKLFKELPDRISVNFNDFDEVFDYETGKAVSIKLASNLTVTGSVVSKAEDIAANVKTIVIRDAHRGAALSLSRYIHQNNTISYRGMFMSFKHDDAYEVALENGNYFLIKKEANQLYEE